MDELTGYIQTPIYGKLITGNHEYWIAAPYPIEFDTPWGEKVKGFLGVDKWEPIGSIDAVGIHNADALYPTIYPIIVSGTWHVILKPPKKGWIWCKASEMLVADDFTNVDVIDPIEPEWLSQMIEFDLVREID